MSALAVGCEPETGLDASVNDAALGQAEAGAPSPDAGATGALDAAPPVAGDASAPSGDATPTGQDATLPPGSDATLPPAGSDASAVDGGLADSAGMDGSLADAGAYDSGTALDAQAPGDAANAETGVSSDGSAADAGQTGHERSGEVHWNVMDGPGTAFCPHQSIALWKQETLTLHDPTSPLFQCWDNCSVRTNLDTSEVAFLLRTDDIALFLIFRGSIMLGYSSESLRANLLRANLSWTTQTKTNIGNGRAELWGGQAPTVEIVSYQAPILHVRVQADSIGTSNQFREQATVPYACLTQGPYGTWPYLCTDVDCKYGTEDPENYAHVTMDLQLPIQQPAP